MNEYGEKSVPKSLFSPPIPFGLQWMWPNSALGILKKENDKVKEQVTKKPEGVRVLVLSKKRCFTLEIVLWHISRSVAGLILPDS